MESKPERFFHRPRQSNSPDDTVILNAPDPDAVTPADDPAPVAPGTTVPKPRSAADADGTTVPKPRSAADADGTAALPAATPAGSGKAEPTAGSGPDSGPQGRPGTTAIPRPAGSTTAPRIGGSDGAGDKPRSDDPAMTAITPVFLDPSSTMVMSTDTEGNLKPAFDPERTVQLPGRADSTMVMPVGATELAGARARTEVPSGSEPAAGTPGRTGSGPGTPPAGGRDAATTGEPRPRSRGKWLVAATVAAVLGAAGAAAGVYATAGDIPRGTRVLGVDVGAKSRAEARRLLDQQVAERAARPVRVRVDGKDVTLQPAAIGLTVDVPATVDAAADSGFRLTGTEDVTPVVRLDQAKLEAALRKQVKPSRFTIRKPRITFAGTEPTPTYAASGVDLDGAAAAASVRRAWPAGEVADVPLTERPPTMTRAQVDALVTSVARPAVAAPVTVTVGDDSLQLPPAAIARGLVFRSDSAGRLAQAIDGAKLHAAAAKQFAEVETEPTPAQVKLRAIRPRMSPQPSPFASAKVSMSRQ